MPTFQDLMIQPSERGIAVGQTGTGKSTLNLEAIKHWTMHPQARVLVIDSKPHYRAEELLNGISAKRHYRKWAHGDELPGSYLLPLHDVRSEIKQVWRLGGKIALAQTDDKAAWPLLEWAMHWFYKDSRAKYRQLVVIDELADFYGTSATFKRGDEILRLTRSGRERGIGVFASTQRPRHIPPAVLTEMTRLYAFRLRFQEDRKRLLEMGLPPGVRWPPTGDKHAFLYFHTETDAHGIYRLKLEGH